MRHRVITLLFLVFPSCVPPGDTLTLFARYQLFDNPAGDPVFGTDIMTNAPVSTGEDATSAIRNRTQATRAIQANITQFLNQLSVFARQPKTGSRPPNLL
jgi:hypothetical protein